MEYRVISEDRLTIREAHSLDECDEVARDYGTGTHLVVALASRFNGWRWGEIEIKGGKPERREFERA